LAGYLPLDFRVLYRQFLLRVIDLEALSIQADVVRFLGQFAGVLIMISLLSALRAFVSTFAPPTTAAGWLNLEWGTEQSAITTMMLVIGLLTVVSWDSTFPDRKDVMVLSPLPVAPHTILFAKVSASCAVRLPPAEPGASFCEPLEAACAGSLTRPRLSWATLSVAGYFHMFSWSIRLSSCSWLRM
jgi:hypothetical protein